MRSVGGRVGWIVTAMLASVVTALAPAVVPATAAPGPATPDRQEAATEATAGCAALGGGTVTVLDPNVTLTRPAAPGAPTCGYQGADLTSAGNEFESFQVVVRAPATAGLTNVRVGPVTPANCFSWCSSDQAKADTAVTVYREDFAALYRRSDIESVPDPAASLTNPNGAGVDWPDALVPAKDYLFGEARSAFPVDVAAGQYVVAWVDVLAPNQQAAGTYTARLPVTATSNGAPVSYSIPITLSVLGFSIPSTPSLDSFVGATGTPARRCPLDPTPTTACGDEDLWQVQSLLNRVAVENRLAISYPMGNAMAYLDGTVDPAQRALFDRWVRPYYTATMPARLPGARLRNVAIYEWCANDPSCVTGLARLAAESPDPQPAYSVYCEELFTNRTKWTSCRDSYRRAKAVWTGAGLTGLGLTAVASIDALNWARNDAQLAWPTVFSDVTTLLPIVQRLNNRDELVTHEPWPGNISAYDAFLNQPGSQRLWVYSSCYSLGCSPDPEDPNEPLPDDYSEDLNPFFRGWPSLGIDQPATEARAMSWLAFRWGTVTGEQYYESLERAGQFRTRCSTPTRFQDNSTCLFKLGGNGDGTLFYYGTPDWIGGTHAIPLESIRVKRMRDGREDYEWLVWLRDHGQNAGARDVAARLFPHAYCTDSPAPAGSDCTQTLTVAAARNELSALVRRVLGADLSVTATAASQVPLGDDFATRLTVRNNGGVTSTGTTVTDTLPVGVRVAAARSSQGSCTQATQADTSVKVTCALGSLAGGVAATVDLTLVGVTGGARTQTARVSGAVTDPVTADNAATKTTTVYGSPNCTRVGTPAADVLTGTAAADVICGLGGNDTIKGSDGNDTIYGGNGVDTIAGDGGDDTLIGGLVDDDTLNGGAGTDTVSVFDAAAGAAVNLRSSGAYDWTQGAGNAGIGYKALTSIESVIGSAYGDALIGGTGNNRLDGGAGNDRFTDDPSGDDTMIGRDGNDAVYGLAGNDILYGGAGNDVLGGGDGNDYLFGGLGTDTLAGHAGTDVAAYADAPSAVDVSLKVTTTQSTGGGGTDTITTVEYLNGSPFADHLMGNEGSNRLNGGAGNDQLVAEGGNDTLNGEAGADFLNGGSETDVCNGGTETDTAVKCETITGVP